jgi:hypothetical protein
MSNLTTTPHFDTNPARQGTGKGPTWAAGPHDDLKLPSGRLVGQVNNEELRAELSGLVEGAHVDGRNVIVARYAAVLLSVFNRAGNAAVVEFLESKRI